MVVAERDSLTEGFSGLSSQDVEQRKNAGQVNVAAVNEGRGYLRIFADNAFAPINVVLYGISIALIALGLGADAFFTAGLVIVNVIVGAFQEAKAKQRLSQIALLVAPQATVIRDGREQTIPPTEIVLGDTLVIRQGDEVQVDGALLKSAQFSADESLLTGESDFVRKKDGDRIFAGSYCMTGAGIAEADHVGSASLASQITAKARSPRQGQTPLQREVSLLILAMALSMAALGAVVAVNFINVYGELPVKETLRAAAVIVALVPQGMAFMVTVSYAMAAVRISRAGTLVQRMNAIESISRVDVLCTDKTGTLTTNQLTLAGIKPFDGEEDQLKRRLGTFAASASVKNRTAETLAEDLNGKPAPVSLEVAFDSQKKWSALAFQGTDKPGFYVLGAPEILMPHLEDGDRVEREVAPWAAEGLRVLLFAYSPEVPPDSEDVELPSGLVTLGLVALRDELRPEAAQTVAGLREAGVRLKVISGDSPETVASLARQAGIDAEHVISGIELEKLSPEQFDEAVERTSIFGRITPDQKERIIDRLNDKGYHVAMIGDGVNDIPALKRSTVSVAMRSGSPATRAVADMVLLHDSFGVLPPAFVEGQRIRAGMRTIIRLFLVRTLALSLIVLGAALLGDDFPTTPRQAGLPAFLGVGLPALVLVATAVPARTARYLLPSSAEFALPSTLLMAAICLALYHGFLTQTGLDQARTALVLAETICGVLLLPYVRRGSQADGLLNPDTKLFALSGLMLLALAVWVSIPPFRRISEIVILTPAGYAVVAFAVVAWAVLLHFAWRFLGRLKEGRATDASES